MAKGKVVQVIGTVVDMEFPKDQLPAINNGIVIPMGENKVIVEVQAHIGNNWVRGVSLTALVFLWGEERWGDCLTCSARRLMVGVR
jgi:F0F1-type ATP synthase beta subunit